ncbi:hypothetical protein HanOQP8_Chr11g0421551 [Helianthus annuus]|nr:hypothetical protein HanHA89_Chr11g0443321 [Helianthus annuus]KAJ0690774.1 hypothetical protein HanOQP8_Chr11g0421551 [Helianthus annuus]
MCNDSLFSYLLMQTITHIGRHLQFELFRSSINAKVYDFSGLSKGFSTRKIHAALFLANPIHWCGRCVLFGKFYSSDSSYELKTSVWVESTSVREVIAQYGLVPSMNRRRYRVASMKTSVRDAIVYHFHHLKIYMYLCYFKTLVILCYFETFVICILVLYYIGSNLILFFVYFVFIFR